jgi:hypothetical protein
MLRVAARRWPRELREDLHREWRAEVHALVTDPAAGRLLRTARAVRFAGSLAATRPVGQPRRPIIDWGGLPVRRTAAVAALGLGALGSIVGAVSANIVMLIILKPAWYQHNVSIVLDVVAAVVVGCGLGVSIGRARGPHRRGPLVSAVGVAGAASMLAVLPSGLFGSDRHQSKAVSIGLWALALTMILWSASAVARRSRWRGLCVGAAAGLLAVYATVNVAVALEMHDAGVRWASPWLWFPYAIDMDTRRYINGFEVSEYTWFFPYGLLASTAFAVCYVVTAQRRRTD